MPMRSKLPHHDFAVHEILRAAQTYKADFQVRISSEGDVLNQDNMGAAEGSSMTDREKAGRRGVVRRVVAETFVADWQTKAMPEEPWARDQATYLRDGCMDEQTYRDSDGNDYTSAYVYDASSRLAEVRCTSAKGDNVTRYAYDPQGRLVGLVCRPAGGPEMTRETYSYCPDGAMTKVVFVPNEPAR